MALNLSALSFYIFAQSQAEGGDSWWVKAGTIFAGIAAVGTIGILAEWAFCRLETLANDI